MASTRHSRLSLKNRLLRIRSRVPYRQTTSFLKRKPLTSFFVALGILFLLIILANLIGAPQPAKSTQSAPKNVAVYRIGIAPKITVQAKVEKSGSIQIVAQTAGIVNDIQVYEGESVGEGTTLLDLASNYTGGSALDISAEIANDQNKNIQDTYQEQVNSINKQRDIANETQANAQDLQAIAQQSVTTTQSLIDNNATLLSELQDQLTTAQSAPSPDPSTISGLQGQINQLQSTQAQLQSQLRTTQLQADESGTQSALTNNQRDLTIMQLDIQQKSLDLNKEVTQLQSDLAYVNASTMHPAAPFASTVDRIFVREGQSVTPGTPLLSLSSDDPHAKAIANVPSNIVHKISTYEQSTLHLSNEQTSLFPAYVSHDATDGQLYSVIYNIPDTYYTQVTDGEYISVDIPVGYPDADAVVPFIPIDAVFQTQEEAYVFVVENNKAASRLLTLGQVFGSQVQVNSGLHKGDQIILDRNVVNGDEVKVEN